MRNLSSEEEKLLEILEQRFEKNRARHKNLKWRDVESRLKTGNALKILAAMEETGGEPDAIGIDKPSGSIIYCDCSPESPSGRRSLCYDKQAFDSRKQHKPLGDAVEIAQKIGIEILSEEQYKMLQELGPFDQKTSSWLRTPAEVRNKGGALFGDFRYGRTFIYHNGAQSYYAARGFRGIVLV